MYLPRFVLNLLRGEEYLNVEVQLQDPELHWASLPWISD
jgi:hypothetical protein